MLNRRHLLASVAGMATLAIVSDSHAATTLKVLRFIDGDSVELSEGATRQTVRRGDSFGPWTLVEILPDQAVLETFRIDGGDMIFVDTTGLRMAFPKTAESTEVDFSKAFLGHTVDDVKNSPADLLGQQILSQPGDPDYATVAAAFPPIRKVWGDTYNFLGAPETQDKVWFAYGGRSPNFDPAVYQPSLDAVRKAGKVWDGLVGGYLPCLRFVYLEDNGDWTEMLAFAPLRMINGNTRMQPVWYRVSRIENGRLAWTRHVDSYLPYPPREGDDPKIFYADLLAFKTGWDAKLAAGMQIEIPDARLSNQARHSLIRAMMGRSEGYPKYGTIDKNYGGTEHDGFPDTFNVETAAMIEWGLIDRAGAYIDNYFGQFVRDDGVILYRGPETGQFGRMLTVVAQYVSHGGDPALVLRHRTRIDAITQVLLGMRAKALTLPKDDPAYGMLSGWSEADAVLEADPQRYMQPYFSNSTEAIRGFRDIGRMWERIAGNDTGLADWGRRLQFESQALEADLKTAMVRSLLTVDGEAVLPTIAGAKEPFHVVMQRDRSDPQWRSYRSWMEMLHSGILPPQEIARVIDYRGRHHDIVAGMPMAYGYRTGEMAGFLSYGHGYGLIQTDRIREALLMTYSSMAHQYTRGGWLAPETRRPLGDEFASAYCSPSQLVCPLMARWLMVFEDAQTETLWLGRGLPQAWLDDGKTVKVAAAPTRWGRVGYTLTATKRRIDATVTLPPGMTAQTRLRLRVRGRLSGVLVNGKTWRNFDPTGDIMLPSGGGDIRVVANITRN